LENLGVIIGIAVAVAVAVFFGTRRATQTQRLQAAAIGLVVGWAIAEIRRRVNDTQLSVTVSLLSGYAAFIPADALGASGVLAAVTTGIYMGIRGPSIIDARTRLQGFMVWDILDFLLNASLFVLVGLQLRVVVDGLSGYSASTLAGYALAVSAVVILARVVWLFTVVYVIRAVVDDSVASTSAVNAPLPARPCTAPTRSGRRASVHLPTWTCGVAPGWLCTRRP